MVAAKCVPQVQVCAMRFSRVATSGAPTIGANNLITTDAQIEVGVSPVYEDGDEIKEKNGCGAVLVNYKSADSFLRRDFTATFLVPDPYIMGAVAGGSVLTSGEAVGAADPALGASDDTNLWAIEWWVKRITGGALDPDFPYARYVMPMVQNIRVGDLTFPNGAVKPGIQGQAVENANWFDGPTNDWPVASTRTLQWLPVTTIPTITCGFQTTVAS